MSPFFPFLVKSFSSTKKKKSSVYFCLICRGLTCLFCLSAKWQRQLCPDTLPPSSLSCLLFSSQFPLCRCRTGAVLPATEDITRRAQPGGLAHLSFKTCRMSSAPVRKLFCRGALLALYCRADVPGLAEEGFDPARSRAGDPQGQQTGSWTPAALVPDYRQFRLVTASPVSPVLLPRLPSSLLLCSFSHGKSSSVPFS